MMHNSVKQNRYCFDLISILAAAQRQLFVFYSYKLYKMYMLNIIIIIICPYCV